MGGEHPKSSTRNWSFGGCEQPGIQGIDSQPNHHRVVNQLVFVLQGAEATEGKHYKNDRILSFIVDS